MLRTLFVLTIQLTIMTIAVAEQSAELGTARLRLDAFLLDFKTFQAEFSQILYDEYGEVIDESKGTVAIARPGKFRWDYLEPYVQSLITDGETLWIFDSDLEQVTVNTITDADQGSPAQLLGGEVDIDAQYVTEELQNDAELAWIKLIPKSVKPSYRQVEIGLDESSVRQMRLVDNLGQTTAITFSQERRNEPLADGLFTFEPPAGVDVVNGTAL